MRFIFLIISVFILFLASPTAAQIQLDQAQFDRALAESVSDGEDASALSKPEAHAEKKKVWAPLRASVIGHAGTWTSDYAVFASRNLHVHHSRR